MFLSNADVPVPKLPVADRVGLTLPFAISKLFRQLIGYNLHF